jgi:ferrous iron transport protein B
METNSLPQGGSEHVAVVEATAAPPLLALVGSANSGKTTLFNALTGSHYNTVNYPGATVEYTLGTSRHLPSFSCRVMDTPGLTSLVPSSPDEKVTVDALFKKAYRPDVVLVVADANQLSRHLYLFRQLQQLGFPLVLVVTMEDLLRRKGRRVDEARLSELLDCPVTSLDPRKSEHLPALSEALKRVYSETRDNESPTHDQYERFASDLDETHIATLFQTLDQVEQLALRPVSEVSPESITSSGPSSSTSQHTAGVDGILLHPIWGLLIFLASMCLIFTAIFWAATPLMNGIDFLFGHLVAGTKHFLPNSWLTDLFADGLLGGIGAVSVFLPQIAILFLCMGYLEDSGYLARGAALVDRPLSKIGLNGKSFVPLLSGYACAIPGMMAARTISNRFERGLTIFIIPLMSCSARLPVYALLLAFLIPRDKPWLGGLALTGLYMMGIILGAIVSTVISRFARMKSRGISGFMLELPALRRPLPRVVIISAWHKTAQYIRKAGPAIVVISLGLWVLTHTPTPPKSMQGDSSEYIVVSHSYAASVGHVIEPLTRPLGLDWRGGVAMICGFAAREVFVSSLALVYRVQETQNDAGLSGKLLSRMHDLRFEDTGALIFTPSTCVGMIVFFMIALQCLSTVAVARKEFGSWKPALIQLALFTGGAYILAVITVQGLRALGIA